MTTSRRDFLRTAAAAVPLAIAPSAIGWDLAQAQAPGGVLRVGMTAAAVPLPNGCPDQGAEGQRFMGITLYDQLVAWDLSHSDQASGLIPCLATKWSADPANLKRWSFTLREGVKFHDGKTLTPEDVVFSFDRAFRKDAAWFDPRAAAQVGLRIPTLVNWGTDGDHGFWMETSIVDSTIPFGVTWVGITHKAAWEAAGKDWNAFLDKAVGTGPWKLDSFKLRERAVLSRFDGYWNKDRVPKCAQLVLVPAPESNTRVAAIRSGQVDFIEAPPPDAIDSLKAAKMQIYTNPYPHNWTWHFSMLESSPWRDIRVRKAANLGIDRAGLKELLGGLMLEGTGLVPTGNPWLGNPSFKLTYDVDAAKKLMAEAGFSPAKPLRTKVGISTSGSGQMQPLSMNEFLQQNLKEIGIEIDFEVLDWNSLIDVWHAGAKSPTARGVTAINFSYAAFDPYNAFIRLLKSSLVAPTGVNWGYFSDPWFDARFEEVYQTFDPAKQDALLRTIHERIVDQALFLFAAHDLNPRALAPKVKGFVQAQSWFQDLTPISVG
ncbi:ABC transporter substrate-binding protein [Acidisphaera sp. L21]|uniref:ABC transporter substrate-binding protein n=1 Tax=Acidisphaera sp. L21 TaxID=1641851 RepID=UPI001C20A08F|nr:ABC transporter substrate-binding protein [Acidisphaera sp. L21]